MVTTYGRSKDFHIIFGFSNKFFCVTSQSHNFVAFFCWLCSNGITVNGKEYEISGKIDFLTILYAVKSGDKVSFEYYANFGEIDPSQRI